MSLESDLLPQYRSHKVVRAAPIVKVVGTQIWLDVGADKPHLIVPVEPGMFARYTPVAGDMLVVYANQDGTEYRSISPRAEFDAGYTKLP